MNWMTPNPQARFEDEVQCPYHTPQIPPPISMKSSTVSRCAVTGLLN
jgi:hypothetical protein